MNEEIEESHWFEEKLSKLYNYLYVFSLIYRLSNKEIIENTFDKLFNKDEKKLIAFELTNGNNTTRQIGKIVGVDFRTIAAWWKNWSSEYGIVTREGSRESYTKRFSLLDMFPEYVYQYKKFIKHFDNYGKE